MAWTDLIAKIDSILQNECGLTEAPEVFSVKLLPETLMNLSYCVWCDELRPNESLSSMGNDTYPINHFRISVTFDLERNDPAKRDESVSKIEEIYKKIIHPSNYSSDTRIIKFIGARTEQFKDEGFWAVADLQFSAEYKLTYTGA